MHKMKGTYDQPVMSVNSLGIHLNMITSVKTFMNSSDYIPIFNVLPGFLSANEKNYGFGPTGELGPIVFILLLFRYPFTIRHVFSFFLEISVYFLNLHFRRFTSLVLLSDSIPITRIGKVIDNSAEGNSRSTLSKLTTFESITFAREFMFRPIYIFVILELKTRRVVHAAVTVLPTDTWPAQQLREATPWDSGPRYLIRDRDRKYGSQFSCIATSTGIKELKTPYRTPEANTFCERFMGSLKRDCLDHMLVMSRKQIERLVREYVNYYNNVRPHQGIHQRIPGRTNEKGFPSQSGKIISEPILGGLHHDYTRIAYRN